MRMSRKQETEGRQSEVAWKVCEWSLKVRQGSGSSGRVVVERVVVLTVIVVRASSVVMLGVVPHSGPVAAGTLVCLPGRLRRPFGRRRPAPAAVSHRRPTEGTRARSRG
jgi:hypothetical protein